MTFICVTDRLDGHVSGGPGGPGCQTADVDVHVHHGAGHGGASLERRVRSRSRAGSVSFPCDQDRMSPSVERSYNFGLPGHSRQVRASELGGGGVQGQGKGQQLISIFAVNDYIWLETCQSRIYEK